MGGSSSYLTSTPTAQTEKDGNSNQTAEVKQEKANKRAYQVGNQDEQHAWEAQTYANRPDINTAYGQQQWTENPDGTWGMSSGFNGTMGDANASLQDQYAKAAAAPMDNGTGARDQAINSAYGQATSRMDPEWNKRQSAMQAQLLNQGVDPNSEAYKSASQSFSNQRNDAYTSAMNAAIAQGTSAGHTAFQDNLSARNAPLQQMQAMNSLLETPKYNAAGQRQTTQYNPVDYAQMTRDSNDAQDMQTKKDEWTGDTVMKGASSIGSMIGGGKG